jgi:hypothetical protein
LVRKNSHSIIGRSSLEPSSPYGGATARAPAGRARRSLLNPRRRTAPTSSPPHRMGW